MPVSPATTRGTQSLVHTLGYCWSRPSLAGLEVLWRWLFGAPALALLYFVGAHIYAATSARLAATGIDHLSLLEPMQAAVVASNVFAILWPPVLHAVFWIAPLLLVGWSFASGVGRNVVLRRYDPALPMRPVTMIVLQLLRVLALGGTIVLWFAAIHWAAGYSLRGNDPSLVLYFALVICISLGVFSLWALFSWVFSIAPLLALLEQRGVLSSLYRSLWLGPLKGKLVEINLVMGIIKLALVVLAMVFSATPLPFESVVHGSMLYFWWALVTLLYLAASDFFQVARLVAFIQFWRVYQPLHSGSHSQVDLSRGHILDRHP